MQVRIFFSYHSDRAILIPDHCPGGPLQRQLSDAENSVLT